MKVRPTVGPNWKPTLANLGIDDIDALVREFSDRRPRGLARAISYGQESGRGAELVRRLYPRTGRAMTLGLTGPPGVGKSTLSSAIVRKARSLGKTVGADFRVDPSSPFSTARCWRSHSR